MDCWMDERTEFLKYIFSLLHSTHFLVIVFQNFNDKIFFFHVLSHTLEDINMHTFDEYLMITVINI